MRVDLEGSKRGAKLLPLLQISVAHVIGAHGKTQGLPRHHDSANCQNLVSVLQAQEWSHATPLALCSSLEMSECNRVSIAWCCLESDIVTAPARMQLMTTADNNMA